MRILSLSLLLAFGAAGFAGDPPPPSLEKPVDYAAWLNNEFGRRIKENAAEKYLTACDAFVADPGADEVAKEKPGRAWDSRDRHLIRKWVEANEDALAHFHAAAKVRRCYFQLSNESGEFAGIALPHLGPLRSVVRVAAARAKLRLLEGDTAGALEDISALLRAGRHLQEQPMVISYLVGLATDLTARNVLHELPLLAKGDVRYEDTLMALRKVDRNPPPMRKALEGERVYFYDYLQRYGRDQDKDGRIEAVDIVGFDPTVDTEPSTDRMPLDPPVALGALTAKYDEYLGIIRRMERARYPEAMDLEKKARQCCEASTAMYVLAPSLWMAEQLRRARDADRNATRIVLRMHAWQAEHSAWPKTLREAMEGELPTLRWDPFSDGELIYRLKAGKPLLYSVGADGEDDRGQTVDNDNLGEKGDIVLWPLPED